LGVTIRKPAAVQETKPARLPKPFAPTKEEQYGQQQVLQAAAAARAKRAALGENVGAKAALQPTQSQEELATAAAERAKRAAAAAKRFGMEIVDETTRKSPTTKASGSEDSADHALPPAIGDTIKSSSKPLDVDPCNDKAAPTKTPPQSTAELLDAQGSLSAAEKTDSTTQDEEWKCFLACCPLVAPAEGIRETSCFNKMQQEGGVFNTSTSLPAKCLKRIMSEVNSLKTNLPNDPNASIWVRFDEETPQFMRTMVAGPLPGPTPYSGGLYTFDIYIPPTYPDTPPKVQIVTTGGGTVRFGPNLYACGKVCLSLLGTWPGPKWSAKHSTLLQVLISIQGLILGVEHPFYLEPGQGGWEGEVKDGDFQSTGMTLSGATVIQEMGVPAQVNDYEDDIRFGTVKYAMIQSLQAAVSTPSNSNRWLQPFKEIIQAHFYQNRDAVLQEVRMWISDDMLGRDRTKLYRAQGAKLSIDVLENTLLPKLVNLLRNVVMPAVDAKPAAAANFKVPPPAVAKSITSHAHTETATPSKRGSTPTTEPVLENKEDGVANKRAKMQAAAQKGDYVLAGKLQEELGRLEQLQASMKKAAEDGDFIRAGRLQAQLKALTMKDSEEEENDDTPMDAAPSAAVATSNNQFQNEGVDSEEVEGEEEDFDSDDGFNGPPGTAATSNLGHIGLGKNVFAPPGWKEKNMKTNNYHSWGHGNTLSAKAPSSATSSGNAGIDQTPTQKRAIPRGRLCRLRIRLPNDESVVEDFDIGDNLSAVYECLVPLVEEKYGGGMKSRSGVVRDPSPALQGSFAQPLSSAGFTLLLTRPKREFNLEMHGTISLDDLNLAPSATLTVMKCQDRGILKRGELESRLGEAQGDAMDVDGLTYEGLVELTERVGSAAPSGGSAFVSLTVEQLDANSQSFSPAEYLATLDSVGAVDEDERRCPVCLGNYDASDARISVRRLAKCGHHFHSACLETWLANKSSCPLCKCSICGDV
jgi:ubiquitin-protein ligase